MKLLQVLLPALFLNTAYAQPDAYSIKDLKGGKAKGDSSYAYALPFEKGSSYFLVQAYDSKLSHRGEFALDFKMKPGSKVAAARDGVVVAVKEDSKVGGTKKEYLSQGNYVIVQHSDGSYAHYWHLSHEGALVAMGDSVKSGQVIGLSGNTGYSAFPHLHFEVTSSAQTGSRQLPTRFYTNKGIRYLRPAHWYKAP